MWRSLNSNLILRDSGTFPLNPNLADSWWISPKFEYALWLCPIRFLAIPINQKMTIRINCSMFTDICHTTYVISNTRWLNILLYGMLVTSDNRKWFKFVNCDFFCLCCNAINFGSGSGSIQNWSTKFASNGHGSHP